MKKSLTHRLNLLAPLALVILTGLVASPAETGDSTETGPSPSSFIRFVDAGNLTGRVETAVKTYRNSSGIEVTLFSAVHVADPAYYRNLQQRFTTCDALLYEMIRDPGPMDPQPEIDTANPVSQLQIGMKNLLDLEFQLDAIDYSPANFVHADLDPTTFFRLQEERNESLLGLMIRLMLEEQARINAGQGTSVNSFGLLFALMNPDRAYALKLTLGQQMEQLEGMLAGIDDPSKGTESVIVSARNQHALEVLKQQIQQGRRRLGIFYGAGHMLDFEKRLETLGFRPAREEWLTAWDIQPKKKPRAASANP